MTISMKYIGSFMSCFLYKSITYITYIYTKQPIFFALYKLHFDLNMCITKAVCRIWSDISFSFL